MKRLGVLAVAALFAGGCAQTPEPLESIEAPKIGPLDTAYDRAKWRWVRNRDGRALLAHAEINPCFVDPNPPPDVHDPGFTLKRSEKTIGTTRYEVVDAYEKRQFWEAVYVRAGTKTPILGVYAEGRCREEAERILERYEKTRAK